MKNIDKRRNALLDLTAIWAKSLASMDALKLVRANIYKNAKKTNTRGGACICKRQGTPHSPYPFTVVYIIYVILLNRQEHAAGKSVVGLHGLQICRISNLPSLCTCFIFVYFMYGLRHVILRMLCDKLFSDILFLT